MPRWSGWRRAARAEAEDRLKQPAIRLVAIAPAAPSRFCRSAATAVPFAACRAASVAAINWASACWARGLSLLRRASWSMASAWLARVCAQSSGARSWRYSSSAAAKAAIASSITTGSL
jgi:hypothetical protein